MKGLESAEYVIRDDEITPEMENFNCDLRRDDFTIGQLTFKDTKFQRFCRFYRNSKMLILANVKSLAHSQKFIYKRYW